MPPTHNKLILWRRFAILVQAIDAAAFFHQRLYVTGKLFQRSQQLVALACHFYSEPHLTGMSKVVALQFFGWDSSQRIHACHNAASVELTWHNPHHWDPSNKLWASFFVDVSHHASASGGND